MTPRGPYEPVHVVQRARIVELDDTLVTAAGLPAPEARPRGALRITGSGAYRLAEPIA